MSNKHIKMWWTATWNLQLEFEPLWPHHLCIWLSDGTRVELEMYVFVVWQCKWFWKRHFSSKLKFQLHIEAFVVTWMLSNKQMGAKKSLQSIFNSIHCVVMDCIKLEVVDIKDINERIYSIHIIWIVFHFLVCTINVFFHSYKIYWFIGFWRPSTKSYILYINAWIPYSAIFFLLTFDLRYH